MSAENARTSSTRCAWLSSWGNAISYSRATREFERFSAISAAFHKACRSRAQRTGASIEVVPDDEHGQIGVDMLRRMMDPRVKLIALTHVPTNGGVGEPSCRSAPWRVMPEYRFCSTPARALARCRSM
jgi:hypothetical protein